MIKARILEAGKLYNGQIYTEAMLREFADTHSNYIFDNNALIAVINDKDFESEIIHKYLSEVKDVEMYAYTYQNMAAIARYIRTNKKWAISYSGTQLRSKTSPLFFENRYGFPALTIVISPTGKVNIMLEKNDKDMITISKYFEYGFKGIVLLEAFIGMKDIGLDKVFEYKQQIEMESVNE